MTTKAAEKLYLAQHENEMNGKGFAVYNPKNKKQIDLPVIYGFNNGGTPGWYTGVVLTEAGTCLGSHICSHEDYMLHDLGILAGTRPDRHKSFKKHYPEGYRMAFVGINEVKKHKGLEKALQLNHEKGA